MNEAEPRLDLIGVTASETMDAAQEAVTKGYSVDEVVIVVLMSKPVEVSEEEIESGEFEGSELQEATVVRGSDNRWWIQRAVLNEGLRLLDESHSYEN